MRAGHKAAIQWAFGRLPGGPRLYRWLTRRVMGTQASHVDKLAHAWPSYVHYWQEHGLDLEGKTIWMHGGGWTVYPSLLAYLITGKGGLVTTWETAADEQYTAKSIEYALQQSFGEMEIPGERLDRLRSISGQSGREILEAIGGRMQVSARVEPALEPSSIDIAVTGGVLEHFTREELARHLRCSHQALRPGGFGSHVFDLRDHLYHADKSIPFLNHLRYSERAYQFRYGHPLGFHNRMLPPEIEEAFVRAGFEVVSIRRRILPKNGWVENPAEYASALVGLDRELLNPAFASATDEDLRTVAIQFLVQKPRINDSFSL